MICYAQKLIAQFSCIIHHQVLCVFCKFFGIDISPVQMESKTKWFCLVQLVDTATQFGQCIESFEIISLLQTLRTLILNTSWIKTELVIKLGLVKFKILSNKNLSNLMKNVQQKSLQIIHFLSDGSWLSPKRFTK